MREAALIVENKKRTLVLADLHLGIEDELRQRGITSLVKPIRFWSVY